MTTDRDALGRSRMARPPRTRSQLVLYISVTLAGFAGSGLIAAYWWAELIGIILPGAAFFVLLTLGLSGLSKLLE